VRENAAGDVLASLTTMVWNIPSKSWTGGATMADASLNRRMTVRLADAVAFAQIGIVGLDGQIELEALRLHGLPEAAPALLTGTPASATRSAGPCWRTPTRATSWTSCAIRSSPDRPAASGAAGAAADAPLQVRLCLALAYADEATARVQAVGLLVKAPNTALPIQSPWEAIMNRQTEIARKLAAELALPPARRSRAAMLLRGAQRRVALLT
jgi:hypothetical protein